MVRRHPYCQTLTLARIRTRCGAREIKAADIPCTGAAGAGQLVASCDAHDTRVAGHEACG